MQRYKTFSNDLSGSMAGKNNQSVVLVGLSKFLTVPINMGKAVLSSDTTSAWQMIQDRGHIYEIVANTHDIPHWYFDPGDEREEIGARRRPSDPYEYWCWKRCLSEDRRISLKDTFNPDPQTWLEGTFGELSVIPEGEDREDDW